MSALLFWLAELGETDATVGVTMLRHGALRLGRRTPYVECATT